MSIGYFCIFITLFPPLLHVSEPCTMEQSLISGDKYRVQDQFFKASTEDDSYPATAARLDGKSWCSLQSDSSLRPYLEVAFGAAVNITTLRIGGFSSSLNVFSEDHYVTRFRVLVDSSTGGTLSPIMSSGNPKEFTRTGAAVGNVRLPYTVTTNVLRIEADEWTPSPPSQVCMTIEAFGCLAVEPVCKGTSLLTNSGLMSSLSVSPSSLSNGLSMLVDEGSEEWCSTNDINGPFYFQLNFTQAVTLDYMQVRGYIRTLNLDSGYVQVFSLQVGDNSGGFLTYTIRNISELRVAGPELETVTFWKSVSGTVFRLNILNYIRTAFSNVCWKIMIYGCNDVPTTVNPMASATTEFSNSSHVPVTTPTNSMTSIDSTAPTESLTKMDSSTSQSDIPTAQQAQGREAIVGGVVGGILGFFIIFVLAVLVAVIVCILYSRKRSVKIRYNEEFRMHSPEHRINNSIYGQEVITGFDDSEGSGGFKTSYFPAKPSLACSPPSSIVSNTYESIPPILHSHEDDQYSKLHGILDNDNSQESADAGMYGTLSESKGTQETQEDSLTDSLTDNPLYGQQLLS